MRTALQIDAPTQAIGQNGGQQLGLGQETVLLWLSLGGETSWLCTCGWEATSETKFIYSQMRVLYTFEPNLKALGSICDDIEEKNLSQVKTKQNKAVLKGHPFNQHFDLAAAADSAMPR